MACVTRTAMLVVLAGARGALRLCGHTPSICDGTRNGGTTLDLQSQGLDGTIPTEIFQYTNLTTLRLINQLSGTLLTEIGFTRLTSLGLHSNQLSGTQPTEIGLLTQLHWLHLDSNQLSGTVPTEMGGLTRLGYLQLYATSLSGTLPPSST